MKLAPIDRARIRVESGCDESTIRKYPGVSDASRRRIETAAAKLGISLQAARDEPQATPGPRARAAG